MTEPTRDDLRVIAPGGYTNVLEDAEFAAIARKDGWVKIDVDVEAMRELAARPYVRNNTSIGIMKLVDSLLDALDPEGDTP